MLVSFFRSSKVKVLFFIPILALLFRIPAFFTPFISIQNNYSIEFINQFFNWVNQFTGLSVVLSAFVISAQAILLNKLVEKHALLKQINYLTAFYLILLNSAFAPQWLLSESMVANLFFLWSIDKMLSLSRSESNLSPSFDSGLLIGIASVFYPSYLLFIGLLILAQFYFNSFGFREFILAVLGAITPYFFWFGIAYTINASLLTFENHFQYTAIFSAPWESYTSFLPLIISILVAVILSLGSYLKGIRVNTVKTKNTLVLYLWIIPLSIAGFYWQSSTSFDVFYSFSLPLAMILSNYALYAKKRWIPEVLVLCVVLAAAYSNFQLLSH